MCTLDLIQELRHPDAHQFAIPFDGITADEHGIYVTGIHSHDDGANRIVDGRHVDRLGLQHNNVRLLRPGVSVPTL